MGTGFKISDYGCGVFSQRHVINSERMRFFRNILAFFKGVRIYDNGSKILTDALKSLAYRF